MLHSSLYVIPIAIFDIGITMKKIMNKSKIIIRFALSKLLSIKF
jgi:hypothetical protein